MPLSATARRARMILGAAATDNFFRAASMLGRKHPRARPERHGVEVLTDIAYGPRGQAHLLDVYRPRERSGPLPTVLYIHGGAFRILSKDTHWVMGLAFARAGYLVFNINYRLAPEHPFPAAIEDCCEALGWTARHASSYGGDPSRLVIAGESAGGNLAAALTLATCFSRQEPYARRAFEAGVEVRAWLPGCGMLQASDPGRFVRRWPRISPFVLDRLHEASEAYLGTLPERHGRALDLADPLCWLERAGAPDRPLPPCFCICGTKDPLIDDAQRLERALRARGAPHRASYYPGEPHAFHALVWREAARRSWRDTFEFLRGVIEPPLDTSVVKRYTTGR